MFESDRDFLNWLAGYFDHGSCCVVAEARQRGCIVLRINIDIFVESEDVATEIRDFFSFDGATLKEMERRRRRYRYEIRAMHEALSFAYQMLPYVKIRKNDLQEVIDRINKWADDRIWSNVYAGPARATVEKVLDVRAMKLTGKLNHYK
jgi:hypothetical protein